MLATLFAKSFLWNYFSSVFVEKFFLFLNEEFDNSSDDHYCYQILHLKVGVHVIAK